MGSVAVMGSVNMDLVLRVPSLPHPGETVLGDRLLTIPGGKGGNQAVAAARLGGRVRFVGRVGGDAFGEELKRGLAADGVDVAGLARDAGEPSGAALILVEEGGENVIAVAPGANGRVGPPEVQRLLAGLGPGDVVVMQLEIPLESVRAAAEGARRVGARVLLNASPSAPLAGQEVPEVDVLVVNEGEAGALSGEPVTDLESAKAAAACLARRAAAVVVTLGAAGSMLFEGGRATLVEPFRVNAVDATAAGDAFVGALALALTEGEDLVAAVRLGNAAGAAATTRIGARTSLPRREDLPA